MSDIDSLDSQRMRGSESGPTGSPASSHPFGEAKRFCDRHGKPLVRPPGGYSLNQVVARFFAQCSGRLGGEAITG